MSEVKWTEFHDRLPAERRKVPARRSNTRRAGLGLSGQRINHRIKWSDGIREKTFDRREGLSASCRKLQTGPKGVNPSKFCLNEPSQVKRAWAESSQGDFTLKFQIGFLREVSNVLAIFYFDFPIEHRRFHRSSTRINNKRVNAPSRGFNVKPVAFGVRSITNLI